MTVPYRAFYYVLPANKCAVGRDALIPPRVQLLPAGKIVDDLIRRTETVYDNVTVDAYVIMPNHLHILFHIHTPGNGGGMGASRPTNDIK